MTEQHPLFEERQYLGRNMYILNLRLVMALFCFAAYAFTHSRHEDLFLLVGLAVLAISIILTMIPHYTTRVIPGAVILDGLWSMRRVKIPSDTLVSAQKVKYSKFKINTPVYSLHRRGVIKFYTSGDWAVELKDRDGLRYRIGSRQPDSLLAAIQNEISKTKRP